MTETNVRIVEPGADLSLEVRVCELIGQDLTPKTFERACDVLRSRGMAAVPSGGEILLLEPRLRSSVVLEDEAWRAEVHDTGRSRTLAFADRAEANLLAQLVERRALVAVARAAKWWKLDSVRIWYEEKPFTTEGGIAAFRRFEISGIVVEGVGVGVVVDIGTAFFTTTSVADFFQSAVPKEKREEMMHRFERLSRRQMGQKATLLYDCGKTKSKCYFEKVNLGETCATTGEIVVRRKAFHSLLAYYNECQPALGVKEGDPVARVSFGHIDHPVPVASNRLRIRVMNDVLPHSLDEVDKIPPENRGWLVSGFWDSMGDAPLGANMPGMLAGFWCPPAGRTGRCHFPSLMFGRDYTLTPTGNDDVNANKDFFRKRLHTLKEKGCFHVPATVTREIHLVVPNGSGEAAASELGEAISKLLSKWTRQNIAVLAPQPYAGLTAGIEMLKAEVPPGIALFIFQDHDPAAYYTVASELKNWRVKRITLDQLESRHRDYVRFRNAIDNNGRPHRAIRAWQSFTEMCALDVLQQMNCVPWRPAGTLNYEAQLAIDVGVDQRYYAVTLLICRHLDKLPHFSLETLVEGKADRKKATINELHLKDCILKLFRKVRRTRFDPLASVCILRDGRECGRELEGIYAARGELVKDGFLKPDAQLDLVDFHKDSLKNVRLWDYADGHTTNVMEGTYVLLGNRDAVMANTGCVTLHQGTAGPVMLSAKTDGVVMGRVLADVHTSSHLNWSSPGVAQSLPISLKRTDEQLEIRTSQEIKRIR